VAQAKQLESQINSLSEQYDGLRIQLTRAKSNAKIAQQAASRGQAALAVGQQAIAQLAAANYMNSGLDPTFQALTAGDSAQFLSQASTIAEIDKVNSAAMKQAMAVFEQTGHYPPISLQTEHTVSIKALQAALTREGDPYVW